MTKAAPKKINKLSLLSLEFRNCSDIDDVNAAFFCLPIFAITYPPTWFWWTESALVVDDVSFTWSIELIYVNVPLIAAIVEVNWPPPNFLKGFWMDLKLFLINIKSERLRLDLLCKHFCAKKSKLLYRRKLTIEECFYCMPIVQTKPIRLY